MSITTLAGVASGLLVPFNYFKTQTVTPVTGTWYSLWTYSGIPGAGTIPSAIQYTGNFYTSASALPTGALMFPAPVTGETLYLARFAGNANTTGTIVLADRIWADSASPVGTTTMAVFSGSFPRSAGIGAGDSSGTGVMLGAEVYTTMGTGTPQVRATVINSQGVGDTLQTWSTIPASAVAGTFMPMYSVIPTNSVTAGKTSFGIRSVSRWHNSATHTSGVWGLTAFRPIIRVCVAVAGVEEAVDALTGGFPILFPNTVPTLFWISGTTTSASAMMGNIQYAQG